MGEGGGGAGGGGGGGAAGCRCDVEERARTARLHHWRPGMAHEHRPPTGYVIYVPVAICIVEVSAFRTLHEHWVATHTFKSPHRTVHTAGDMVLGPLKKGFAG